MQANVVEIDFRESQNKICLLIGKNGSGKTTILSMLHPFADLGNLDVRNGNDYILEDEEGYKEIEIQHGEHVYVIKHFYSPHKGKSHSVKSYIAKDGVELNTNGNVSSFKEYVKEELKIEPEYLKLIRLGSNVTNLINLSATERKNFMSKMLEDIGIYLEYYKSINTKLRQLSDFISHDEDQLKRLNIIDEKITKDELEQAKLDYERESARYTTVANQIAIHKREIEQLDDVETLRDNLHTVRRKLDKMSTVKAQKIDHDAAFYNAEISRLEKENLVLETEASAALTNVQRMIDSLDTLEDQRRSLDIRLQQEATVSDEIDRMTENLNQKRLQLRAYEKNIGDFNPKYTKDDFLAFYDMLKQSDSIVESTYAIGKHAIEKVVELMREQRNVGAYIDSHIIALDEQRSSRDSKFLMELMTVLKPEKDVVFACDKECQARALYNRMVNLLQVNEAVEPEKDVMFYEAMKSAYENIKVLLTNFANHKTIMMELPKKIKQMFLTETVFDNLVKMKPLYDKKLIDEILSQITELDNYETLSAQCKEDEKLFEKFSSLSHAGEVLQDVSDIDARIEKMRDDITNEREHMLKKKEQISANNKTLDMYNDIRETLEEYDNTVELYETYSAQYTTYKTNLEQIETYQKEAGDVRIHMELLNKQVQDLTTALTVYGNLTKQLKKYHKIYDEMVLVKEALSSKEGIPLYFITNYLGNVEGVTNELLSIVYHGDMYIDNFVITPTEFSIPFYHNGVRLSDVKYASQGELSFLSLALSFALTAQSISTYNITLADEIDGALDTENRAKFIEILENQIDRIQSEQNFLITHNNMFSSYPVDIIDLSFENDKEAYPLANYIQIIRR